MATPAGTIEIPIAVLEPDEYSLRQYIGRAGFAGGAELELSMDPTGTRIYFETDDAQTFVLMIGDVAIKILEDAPTAVQEETGPQPKWPLVLSGGAHFEDVSMFAEAVREGWVLDAALSLPALDAGDILWDINIAGDDISFRKHAEGPATPLGS